MNKIDAVTSRFNKLSSLEQLKTMTKEDIVRILQENSGTRDSSFSVWKDQEHWTESWDFLDDHLKLFTLNVVRDGSFIHVECSGGEFEEPVSLATGKLE